MGKYKIIKQPNGKYKLHKNVKPDTKEVSPDELAQKAMESAKEQC